MSVFLLRYFFKDTELTPNGSLQPSIKLRKVESLIKRKNR